MRDGGRHSLSGNATECLGYAPKRLGAFPSYYFHPVQETCHTVADVGEGTDPTVGSDWDGGSICGWDSVVETSGDRRTIVATTIAIGWRARGIEHEGGIHVGANDIHILHDDVSSSSIRREVVVLAVEHEGDRMIAIEVVDEIVRGRRGIEGI